MQLSRYKILTGPLAGQIVTAHQLERRATPTSELDNALGSGIWIPSLGVRVAADQDAYSVPSAYVDLVVPFDRFNQEIFIGDTLHAASKAAVIRVKVTGIGKSHWDSGHKRKLRVQDIDSGATLTINNPAHCIKIV